MPRNWQGQLVRFSLFPTAAVDIAAFDHVWDSMIVDQPEVDERKPREQARRQAGIYANGIAIEVQMSPARLDVIFRPAMHGPDVPDGFGSFAPLFQEVAQKFGVWLATVNFDLGRLAIGTVVTEPADSRIDSYRTILNLTKSLRLDLDTPVSDLIFQINHPVQSDVVAGLTINRLMKFTSLLKASVTITLNPDAPSAIQTAAPPKSFSVLDLDVNSAPGVTLPRASLGNVMTELVQHTLWLNENGEP